MYLGLQDTTLTLHYEDEDGVISAADLNGGTSMMCYM